METINNKTRTKSDSTNTCLSCLFLQQITDYSCSIKHYYACFLRKKSIDPHQAYKSCDKFQKRFERGAKKNAQ